jgi:ribosomal protein S27AE
MKNKIYSCAKCGKELRANETYYYVDGNNIAITKNSKPYCGACYDAVYAPRFWCGPDGFRRSEQK